jgi:pyruvate/2-oxoglutarate/acetoin dehydrogenase E1 component
VGGVLTYLGELRRAMAMLAAHPRTLFVGQAVKFPGQRAFETFADVPMDRRIEMPVAEDFQMGCSTGLALMGYVPVSFYPRMDFLIIAVNQLVNHLDKLAQMGGYGAKVIIRTAVGAHVPLDPGPQHTQDHVEALRRMLRRVQIVELLEPQFIVPHYRWALESPDPVIVVERMQLY